MFGSLWHVCLPEFFITVFSPLNYEAMRPLWWGIFFTFVSVRIFVYGLICSRPLFQYIFNIAVPVWGHMHHLAQVLKPWKSELCLWITVHQNNFPLHPPQVALITDESLLSVVLTLLAMFLVSAGEPGLYLVWSFLPKWILHAVLRHSGPHVQTEGGTWICLSLCDGHTVIAPPPHNSFHLSAALPSSGCWQGAHCSPVSLNSLCVCVRVLKHFLWNIVPLKIR